MDPIILIAFFIAILWGFQPIVHRYALVRVSGPFILLISAVTYFIAVMAYIYFWKWPDVSKDLVHSRKFIPILSMTTLIGLFFANLVYLYSIKHASNVNIVVTISALYPVVTLILASIFLKETLHPLGLIGFFMILAGIAILLYTSKPT